MYRNNKTSSQNRCNKSETSRFFSIFNKFYWLPLGIELSESERDNFLAYIAIIFLKRYYGVVLRECVSNTVDNNDGRSYIFFAQFAYVLEAINFNEFHFFHSLSLTNISFLRIVWKVFSRKKKQISIFGRLRNFFTHIADWIIDGTYLCLTSLLI